MKIILNIATHGDEKIGHHVVKETEKLNIGNNLIVQVANEKAFKLNKRFIDQDLNRSFPGKKVGNYEEMRAYELSTIIKSADIVIDIHSTTSALKDAFIVTKLDNKTLKYIKIINPKYVLVMNATKNNALISQAKVGIAFEYGKDNDPKVIKKIVLGIKKLLKYLQLIDFDVTETKIFTKYFDVVSTVEKPKGFKLLKKIKNYKLIRNGEVYAKNGNTKLIATEDFFPIIFGQKNYKDIFGFKGKKIKL
jgi:succinylglutamate desuccinylase